MKRTKEEIYNDFFREFEILRCDIEDHFAMSDNLKNCIIFLNEAKLYLKIHKRDGDGLIDDDEE